MIATQNISLSYSGKPLFKNVNIKFTAGNCYGIIGANGTGKSTFLKVLSGELEPTTGEVVITPGERMAVLRQNHFEFDQYEVLQTVIMGHKRLYEIMKEKDELYARKSLPMRTANAPASWRANSPSWTAGTPRATRK